MKKPCVAFDARMWDHPGIGRYICELTRELVTSSREYDFLFLAPRAFETALQTSRNHSCALKQTRSGIYGLLEQGEILLKSRDADLLHVPHFNIPVLTPKKLVVTVHDLIYAHDAKAARSSLGRSYVRFLLSVIQKKAAAVITVSENTKKDLLECFPKIRSERVFVIHEASAGHFKVIEDSNRLRRVQIQYGLTHPFVLSVGSLKAHKNIPLLIQALATLREKKDIHHDLVLVGRKDKKNTDVLDLIEKTSFVRYLGELSDEDLATLYNLADVLVMPSLFEGFGLPAVEAMACGAPVLVSNRSSLPEVVGEAGLLFDPLRIDALEQVLYNVLKNRELREKMSQAGMARSKFFTWRRAAEETLRVYKEVLG